MISRILQHLRTIFSCPLGYEDGRGFHLGDEQAHRQQTTDIE